MMTDWFEEEAARRLAEAQAKQDVHRRLLEACQAGVEPAAADVAAAAAWNSSPYRDFDRVNAPDDY
jgi:hypothetical protein